jgi:HD-GYP domain-containing protein (c-di-GMP phosphodiesterase class II)
MKKVPVSSILPGTTIWHECYSERGDLLLTPGTTITDHHLDILKKRNIFELYMIAEEEKQTELPALRAASQALKETKIGWLRPAQELSPRAPEQADDHTTISQDFERLRYANMDQLVRGPVTRQLDLSSQRGRHLDRPVGVGVKNSVRREWPADRTDTYKADVLAMYREMLGEIRDFVRTVLRGAHIDVAPMRLIAERLLRVLASDRDILLNLSGVKSEGDDYIYNHMLNCCILAQTIAVAAGYNKEQVITIGIGALLHDTGMLLVSKDIRNKKAKLSPDEFTEIQKHPVLGVHVVDKIRHIPEQVMFMLYQSHERENGSGYPRKSGGPLIHRYAKIIQIADVFEALTSPRQHRSAFTPFESMETLIRMTERGLLSSPLVKALLAYTSLFPVGCVVELSDHRLARVVHAHDSHFHRPVVSVIRDEKQKLLTGKEIYQIDLSFDDNISIIRALSLDSKNDADLMHGF